MHHAPGLDRPHPIPASSSIAAPALLATLITALAMPEVAAAQADDVPAAFYWATTRPTVVTPSGQSEANVPPSTPLRAGHWYRFSTPSAAFFKMPCGTLRATNLTEIRFEGSNLENITFNQDANVAVYSVGTRYRMQLRYGYATVRLHHQESHPRGGGLAVVIDNRNNRSHVMAAPFYSHLEVINHNRNNTQEVYQLREHRDGFRAFILSGNQITRHERTTAFGEAAQRMIYDATDAPADYRRHIADWDRPGSVVATIARAARRTGPRGVERWLNYGLRSGEWIRPLTSVLVVCPNGGQFRIGANMSFSVEDGCNLRISGYSQSPDPLEQSGIVAFRAPTAAGQTLSIATQYSGYEGRGSGLFGASRHGGFVSADAGNAVWNRDHRVSFGAGARAYTYASRNPPQAAANGNAARQWYIGQLQSTPQVQEEVRFFPEAQAGTEFLSGTALAQFMPSGIQVAPTPTIVAPARRTPIRRIRR